MTTWIALGLLLIAGFVLVLRHDAGTIAGFDSQQFASLVAGIAILIFIVPSLFRSGTTRMSTALRDLVTWAAIALALVAGYAYRDDFRNVALRVLGELAPAGTDIGFAETGSGERAVRLRRHEDGHFVAKVKINGETIDMIVDTGASGIVLRPADAERVGIDTSRLVYSIPVSTANGTGFAARVVLDQVSLGSIGVGRMEALVAAPGALSSNLLGMTFLSRLRSYEFSGDYLTLRG